MHLVVISGWWNTEFNQITKRPIKNKNKISYRPAGIGSVLSERPQPQIYNIGWPGLLRSRGPETPQAQRLLRDDRHVLAERGEECEPSKM